MSVPEQQDLKERYDKLSSDYDTDHKTVKDELHKLTAEQSVVNMLTAGQKQTVTGYQTTFNAISKPTRSGEYKRSDLVSVQTEGNKLKDLVKKLKEFKDECAIED